MDDSARRVGRALVVLTVGAVALVVGWALFVFFPTDLASLFGVLLALGFAAATMRWTAHAARAVVPDYNVAEVAVDDPITRDGSGGIPPQPGLTPADDVVEQIERADDDANAEALLLRLNTPGGEVIPSDDIRNAAADFDGPTVAYATDLCASGGYWIASGCDEIWARDASIVGSIGVIGSRLNAEELADRVGLSYEQLTAGEYKDAGMPLKELTDDERAYLQGIVDDYYDHFVERVTEGRDLDPDAVRDTEARVFLGDEAHEIGLVDAIGTRDDVEDRIAERLDVESVGVREFESPRGLMARMRGGALALAYSFGAGVASVLGDGDVRGFEFRLR